MIEAREQHSSAYHCHFERLRGERIKRGTVSQAQTTKYTAKDQTLVQNTQPAIKEEEEEEKASLLLHASDAERLQGLQLI